MLQNCLTTHSIETTHNHGCTLLWYNSDLNHRMYCSKNNSIIFTLTMERKYIMMNEMQGISTGKRKEGEIIGSCLQVKIRDAEAEF